MSRLDVVAPGSGNDDAVTRVVVVLIDTFNAMLRQLACARRD